MYEVAAITSVGLVRDENEDCASVNGRRVFEGDVLSERIETGSLIAMVADGMGGHARGEVASSTVLHRLEQAIGLTVAAQEIVPAIRSANRAVYDLASSSPQYRGMGATLVGVLIAGSSCTHFNVGDSRAYRWRKGALQQLSIDHVPPTPKGHPRSHAVTQSLGGAAYYREVMPAVGSFNLHVDDRIILCSDGLTDVLGESEIGAAIASASPEGCVSRLLNRVLSEGAPDNVTIVVIACS